MLPTDWLMYKQGCEINQPRREPARISTNWHCVSPQKMLVETMLGSLGQNLPYLL